MEIALLHKTYFGQMRPPNRPNPPNQAQVHRALLHQRGLPHLINPRWRLPYYTSQATTDLPEMETALGHQRGPLLMYPRWRLPYYNSQDPANLPQMEITLLHQTDPLLIDPDGDCTITPNSSPAN